MITGVQEDSECFYDFWRFLAHVLECNLLEALCLSRQTIVTLK